MRAHLSLFAAASFASSAYCASFLAPVQHYFSNPSPGDTSYRLPTPHESAVQARRILRLENIATLSTVFPSGSHSRNDSSLLENRPEGLGGAPIGLMDYYADCEPDTGNPTILAIDIATSFKNVAVGSNITLSLRWHPQDGKWHSAANLPRFALVGHLEDISESKVDEQGVKTCFAKSHPDAVSWYPGNRIHRSRWVRLVVEQVYWIGGFGDRAYIGWIPVEDWRNVTRDEIDDCRLPGERSKKFSFMEWL